MDAAHRLTLFVAVVAAIVVGSAAPHANAAQPNTGLPGSACAPITERGAVFTPPGPGVNTTGLGVDAPAYYEVGAPSGVFLGRAPKGIMIVIHGGGWFTVGKETLARWGRPMANRWRSAGWTTVNIDYRACGQSVHDVMWFMQRVRRRFPTAPICATGASAGGHLAMVLATRRTDLACAIAHAGPTDLLALERQLSFDARGRRSPDGPRLLSNYAIAAFGPNPVAVSPRQNAARVRARLLLASGETDWMVPPKQDKAFAQRVRTARPGAYVDVFSLPPGDQPFVHTTVTRDSLRRLKLREDALVAPLVSTPRSILDR